ncbi:uncharacterized protein FFE2_15210 [Fusarium fujikuroi]|nr:uncharacterized protein FFE2_15210 [Fusarium fujikuroi]
MYMPGKEVVV